MKLLKFSLLFISFLSLSVLCKSQTSTTAGYVLFGKNKSEQIAACSEQGICKMQQMMAPDYIPVTFSATPFAEGSNEYSIKMTFKLEALREKQPHQIKYFEDTKEAFIVSDKFVIPKWLIAGLGFNATKNKFITIQAPFSMGVPSVPDQEGNITIVLAERITIRP